jgi:hypothetical protein
MRSTASVLGINIVPVINVVGFVDAVAVAVTAVFDGGRGRASVVIRIWPGDRRMM